MKGYNLKGDEDETDQRIMAELSVDLVIAMGFKQDHGFSRTGFMGSALLIVAEACNEQFPKDAHNQDVWLDNFLNGVKDYMKERGYRE